MTYCTWKLRNLLLKNVKPKNKNLLDIGIHFSRKANPHKKLQYIVFGEKKEKKTKYNNVNGLPCV